MASMRDIKRRKSSVQSTQQITKAMKLVSSKLRGQRGVRRSLRHISHCMYDTVAFASKAGTGTIRF